MCDAKAIIERLKEIVIDAEREQRYITINRKIPGN
jgi:hypothetical protein